MTHSRQLNTRRAVKQRVPAVLVCIGIAASFMIPAGFLEPLFTDPLVLFRSLDYEAFPGLEPVRQHVQSGDLGAARVALHHYFTTRERRPLNVYGGNVGLKAEADKVVNRIFTIQGKTFQINDSGNRTVNGRNVYDVNFHRNPDPDGDMEWIWQFNRGSAWMSALARVARGYLDAGNVSMGNQYAAALVDLFTLFRENEPIGSSFSWRTIDSAIRLGNMILSFDAIRDSETFTPDACFNYLTSLLEHGSFLHRFHKTRTNWAWIEASNLVTLAAYMPELLDTRAWLDECWAMLARLVTESVYPDGGTNEQSIEYHLVMLGQLLDVLEITRAYPGVTAPADLDRIATRMAVFLVHNTMPDWRCTTFGHADLRDTRGRIGKSARLLPGTDPDLDYFDASGNPNVTRPPPRLNAGFHDSGIFTSRTAWNDPMALFSFFDGSPYGFGYHQNDDVLNVMLHGYGRRLIIDPGRYSYLTDAVSMYLRSAHAHNTVIIDGKGLFGVGATGTAWAGGKVGSSARAWHEGYGPRVERELTSVNFRANPAGIPVNQSTSSDPARYWIVSDFWHGEGNHDAWLHWQLPAHQPVATTRVAGGFSLDTNFPSGNLATIALGPWTIAENITAGDQTVHGLPYGYWSPQYNVLEPATTYRFLGTTSGPSSWATILYPYDTTTSVTVDAIPFTIGPTGYQPLDFNRPANVIVVNLPDGSKDIHVTREQGAGGDVPVAFVVAGHAMEVRGTQASFHVAAGSTTPTQVLARDLISLQIDGTTWISIEGTIISMNDASLDFVSLGIATGASACTIIVNGTALSQSRYWMEEGCVNVELMA